RHSCEHGGAGRGTRGFPKICDHWLSCGQPFESMQRNWKIVCSYVFAECEKRVMPLQIFDCRLYAFIDLDLFNAGIALDVKNAIGNEQVVVEFLGATDVQDCICIAIELPDFFQRHAGSWSSRQVPRAIRPAI